MSRLDDAITHFADSGAVLVAPDDEADTPFIAAAAESITSASLDELARLGGGMVLLALDDRITQRLALLDAVPAPRHRPTVAFVAQIDAVPGAAGRWSVTDPATTMRVAAAPDTGPDDLAVPGRVQPVRSERNMLLQSGGTVPAALELAHRGGRNQAVALCAVVGGHGASMDVPRVHVAALRARAEVDRARALAVSCRLPTTYGDLRAVAQSATTGGATLALVHGDPAARARPIVSAHSACLLGDTLGSRLCDCRSALDRSLARIVADGAGVLIYTKPLGGAPVVCGRETRADAPVVAGLLGRLGIRSLRLTRGEPALAPALRGLGLDVETG
jgi:3,4-dihydroxy 2-butanone 4-phosphate synthase / GTP cyclohydrolase II